MTIREMSIEDIGAVAELEREDSLNPWNETGLFTYFIRDDAVLLVAEEDGEILGFAGALLAPPEADILDITIRRDTRRKGYGSELFSALIEKTESLGVNTVFLEVREGNDPARSLYRKFGFRETGIRKNYYTDPPEDGISMALTRNS